MKDPYYFLNSLNIGIIVLNEEKKISFVNNWLTLKLPESSEIRTGNILGQKDDKEFNRFYDALDSALKDGHSSLLTTQLNKIPIQLVHGTIPLSCNVSISRLSQSDDKEAKILLQFTDVTQVKERERFLKEKQKEIDKQREKSFYQERLSALGEMTTSIAHEINNPLAILEMSYRTLRKMLEKKELLSEDFEELFDDGHKTIKRINDLINSVRDLAHSPSLDDFSKETVATVLNSALIVFIEKSRSHGVELKIDLEKEVFNKYIDLNRPLLGQVFVNLLNNAFHAIRDLDEKWVEIDGEIIDDNLVFYFTDSGNGIPQEIQEKVFLPFYTTKDIGEGTGLGLSTTLKIMAAHSGEIRIDNTSPNTKFIITIPIEQ